jgi:hypothetical protein
MTPEELEGARKNLDSLLKLREALRLRGMQCKLIHDAGFMRGMTVEEADALLTHGIEVRRTQLAEGYVRET